MRHAHGNLKSSCVVVLRQKFLKMSLDIRVCQINFYVFLVFLEWCFDVSSCSKFDERCRDLIFLHAAQFALLIAPYALRFHFSGNHQLSASPDSS